jgi:predicted transcriptional regulator
VIKNLLPENCRRNLVSLHKSDQILGATMADDQGRQKVDPGLVAEIVRGYVANNTVAVDQIGELIATVQRTLTRFIHRKLEEDPARSEDRQSVAG